MISRFSRCLSADSNLTALIISQAVAGLLQGACLAMLVPFLRAFLAGRPTGTWLVTVCILALLSLIMAASSQIKAFEIASYDVCGNLIRTVGHKVQSLPLGWFNASTTGRIATTTSTDVNTLSHLPAIVIPYVALMSGTATAIVVTSLVLEPLMAVAMLLGLPGAYLSLRWLARSVRSEYQATEVAAKHLGSRILEFSRLQAVLRATGTATSPQGSWAPLEEALQEDYVIGARARRAKGPSAQLFHTCVHVCLVLAIAVGVWLLLGGRLDPPVFIALALMAVRFAEPLGMLAFYVDPLHESDVALEAVTTILDTPALPEPSDEAARLPATADINLEHVTFGYSADRPVIKDLSLHLPAHSVTALVGPSGSGKSTLVRLIARFWDVAAGSVSLGGVDVRQMHTHDLMNRVSMVFQDVYLFDTTIEENVRIGREDATDAEVRDAADRAGLTEVVQRLPQGWATSVGEGGSSLSGGERQRVAIARAFLKDSPVLLLDEVTSALDGVSEAAVAQAIEELSQGRTVVVIAHRLSTIRRADQIVVLVDGAIEATGSHEELYAEVGTYRQFWDDQSAVDRWRLAASPG